MKINLPKLSRKNKIAALLTLIIAICALFFTRDSIRCIYWNFSKDLHCINLSQPLVVNFLSDSLNIVADYYKPENPNSYSILLLHGSSPEARKSAFIRTLGTKFSELGYKVLAIDHRGYGDSQKPAFLSVNNFDFGTDAERSIDFLISKLGADSSRVFVVGHSFGAGVALTLAAKKSKVNKIVLFGPPRRLDERFFSENALDQKYFLERWQKDMRLNYDLNFDVWKDVYRRFDIQEYFTLLKSNNHLPIYLIDGDQEKIEDRIFLKNIFLQSNPPVDYWTVKESNHYLNIKMRGDKIISEGSALADFISNVSNWLIN